MSIIAAADIGYSNFKLAKFRGNSLALLHKAISGLHDETPLTDEDGYPVLEMLTMEAGAAPVSDLVDAMSGNIPGYTVEVNGDAWQAPIDFSDSQQNHRDFSHQYATSDRWLALLKGGLATMGEPVIDELILGLPCSEYYETPELRDLVIRRALGTHTIEGFDVEVKNVKVIPQPLGSFYGFMLESPKNLIEVMIESVVLVIDPGFYSFDFCVLVEGTRLHQGSSSSTPDGVKAICDKLLPRLKEKKKIPIQPQKLESQLRKGKHRLPTPDGEMFDFTEDLNEVAEEVASTALTAVRTKLRDCGLHPSIAIVTGGGASYFEPHVKEGTDVGRVYMTSDPVMMNALGYLRHAVK